VPIPVFPGGNEEHNDNNNKNSILHLKNDVTQMINLNGERDDILQNIKSTVKNNREDNYYEESSLQNNNSPSLLFDKNFQNIERNSLKNELILDFEKLIQNPKNGSVSDCKINNISANNIPRFEDKSDLNGGFPKFKQKEEEEFKLDQIPDP
jgi:hypothetical protein